VSLLGQILGYGSIADAQQKIRAGKYSGNTTGSRALHNVTSGRYASKRYASANARRRVSRRPVVRREAETPREQFNPKMRSMRNPFTAGVASPQPKGFDLFESMGNASRSLLGLVSHQNQGGKTNDIQGSPQKSANLLDVIAGNTNRIFGHTSIADAQQRHSVFSEGSGLRNNRTAQSPGGKVQIKNLQRSQKSNSNVAIHPQPEGFNPIKAAGALSKTIGNMWSSIVPSDASIDRGIQKTVPHPLQPAAQVFSHFGRGVATFNPIKAVDEISHSLPEWGVQNTEAAKAMTIMAQPHLIPLAAASAATNVLFRQNGANNQLNSPRVNSNPSNNTLRKPFTAATVSPKPPAVKVPYLGDLPVAGGMFNALASFGRETRHFSQQAITTEGGPTNPTETMGLYWIYDEFAHPASEAWHKHITTPFSEYVNPRLKDRGDRQPVGDLLDTNRDWQTVVASHRLPSWEQVGGTATGLVGSPGTGMEFGGMILPGAERLGRETLTHGVGIIPAYMAVGVGMQAEGVMKEAKENPGRLFGELVGTGLILHGVKAGAVKGLSGVAKYTGLTRTKLYSYKQPPHHPLASQSWMLEQILNEPTVSGARGTIQTGKGILGRLSGIEKQWTRSYSEAGGTKGHQAQYMTISPKWGGKVIQNRVGQYFIDKGTKGPIDRFFRARVHEVENVRTIASEFTPREKTLILDQWSKTGKLSASTYKTMMDRAAALSNRIDQPVLGPTPKLRTGSLKPELESMLFFGNEASRQITSSKFKGFTDTGVIIRAVRFGKQEPIPSHSAVLENIRYNLRTKDNYLKAMSVDMNRKMGELYGKEITKPGGQYNPHGIDHLEAVSSNLRKFRRENPILRDIYTSPEAKTMARLHDAAKIYGVESEPFPHAEAAGRAIKAGYINYKPLQSLPKTSQLKIASAIEQHTRIAPGWGTEGLKTKILYRPNLMDKALANADRLSWAKKSGTIREGKIFPIPEPSPHSPSFSYPSYSVTMPTLQGFKRGLKNIKTDPSVAVSRIKGMDIPSTKILLEEGVLESYYYRSGKVPINPLTYLPIYSPTQYPTYPSINSPTYLPTKSPKNPTYPTYPTYPSTKSPKNPTHPTYPPTEYPDIDYGGKGYGGKGYGGKGYGGKGYGGKGYGGKGYGGKDYGGKETTVVKTTVAKTTDIQFQHIHPQNIPL